MARKKKGTAGQSSSGLVPAGYGLGGQAVGATAPRPPVNPYVQQTPPVDPQFEAYKVSAARNVALADADATYKTQQIENSYGLGADRSNPYSQARMLEDAYNRSQRGTTNSYAAQGQLYSGAYKRMQGENSRNYEIGYDRLARDYQDAKFGVLRGQLGSYADYGVGVDDERFRSILRALGG